LITLRASPRPEVRRKRPWLQNSTYGRSRRIPATRHSSPISIPRPSAGPSTCAAAIYAGAYSFAFLTARITQIAEEGRFASQPLFNNIVTLIAASTRFCLLKCRKITQPARHHAHGRFVPGLGSAGIAAHF
jgi:hypothetical protein